MLKIPIFTALACTMVLSACEAPATASADDAAVVVVETPANDAAARGLVSGNVALPAQMALVTAGDEARSAIRTLTSTRALRAQAAVDDFDEDSAYNTAHQNAYVWLDASEPIDFIDSFLCFTGQTQPLEMMGEGDYLAWVDAGCFEARDGGGQEKGDAKPAPAYVTTIANASMAEADDSPLVINGWVPEFPNEGGKFAVKLLGEISEIPSKENPFGIFTLTYGLLPTMESDLSESLGSGEVISSITEDKSSSFTLYQKDLNQDQGVTMDCTILASVNYNETTQDGRARTSKTCIDRATDLVIPDRTRAFALSVNKNYVHMATADTLDDLASPTADVCLERNEIVDHAFDYSLYNTADGSDVVVNSSVQLHIDADGTNKDGSDSNRFESSGQIGYWGSWREDNKAWTNGEKVQQSTRDDSVGATYTVKVAPGKLVKNTIEAVPLTQLADVEFKSFLSENDYILSTQTDFDGDALYNSSFEVTLKVNNAQDGFEVTGRTDWNEQGPEVVNLDTPIAVSLKIGAALSMWSNQLGGHVKFAQGSEDIGMFVRSYVDGSENKAGELFESNTNPTLTCVEQCLKAGVTAADIAGDWEAVFVSGNPATTATYNFGQASLTLADSSTDFIVYGNDVDEDALRNSNNWGWGLETGPMVTSVDVTAGITDADTFYAALKNGDLASFYTWETGFNSWQKQTLLMDENNKVVSFERPIVFKYAHSTANDRNGANTQDGAVFLMEYGGKGNLNGLPWEQEVGKNNWYPVISINDGTLVGPEGKYILKAMNIEQRMSVALDSACEGLPLGDENLPSQPIPNGVTQDVFGLGNPPNLPDDTEASVVSGEVQSAE
jgi:hypothetical protein